MRLIDLDRVCLEDVQTLWCADLEAVLTAVADYLGEQPTVDAVPVVRCRECRYWTTEANGFCGYETTCGHPYGIDGYTTQDDYCSRGERRSDNG